MLAVDRHRLPLSGEAASSPSCSGRLCPSMVVPRSILLKQRRREQPTSSEDLYPDQPTAVVEIEVDCSVLDLKVNHLGSGRATRLP